MDEQVILRAVFLVFPGFYLKILQELLREPCNQNEIVAVIFRQFPREAGISRKWRERDEIWAIRWAGGGAGSS